MMGRLSDRFGIVAPALLASLCLPAGLLFAARATELWHFSVSLGVLCGLFGMSATFAPVASDISHWVLGPPRPRARDRDQRHVRRGCRVAAGVAALDRHPRLAGDVPGTGKPDPVHDAAARHRALPARAHRSLGRFRDAEREPSAPARILRPLPAGVALHRGDRLLRGDGDAPGPHRAARARSRIRRGARRAHARTHARVRGGEPAGVGLDLGSHRRAEDPAPRLGAAGAGDLRLPVRRRAHRPVRPRRRLRPLARGYRPVLHDDHPRAVPRRRGGLADRHDHAVHDLRHGPRRLARRRPPRSHRGLHRLDPRRVRVQHPEPGDRDVVDCARPEEAVGRRRRRLDRRERVPGSRRREGGAGPHPRPGPARSWNTGD